MKKIIIIALCCLMVATMIVPVSADETTVYADVQFNPNLNGLYDYAGTSSVVINIKFWHNGTEYKRMSFESLSGSNPRVYFKDTNDKSVEAFFNRAWQGTPSYAHIQLLEYPSDDYKAILEVIAEVEYYVHGGGELPPVERVECDGSMCPVQDFNVDEICDTCGNPIAYNVQRTYTPNGWGDYPLPPLGYGADSKYIIIQDAVGDKWLYALTPSASGQTWYTTSYGDTAQRIWLENADGSRVNMTFRSYLLDDINNEWEQKVTNTLTELNFSRVEAVVYYSSLELYNEDGSLFFPQPLWMEVQKGYTLTQLMSHLMGTMGQLMIVGIGLIVSLIGLILLVKVLRKSVTN